MRINLHILRNDPELKMFFPNYGILYLDGSLQT